MKFNELLGKTITSIKNKEGIQLIINTDDGKYALFHEPDCCESVYIDDINGNLTDLIGSPLTMADESSSEHYDNGRNTEDGTHTWTFYRLATVKGYVTIKWFGESNGYYSEEVSFSKISTARLTDHGCNKLNNDSSLSCIKTSRSGDVVHIANGRILSIILSDGKEICFEAWLPYVSDKDIEMIKER